jgi:hypothetical protein
MESIPIPQTLTLDTPAPPLLPQPRPTPHFHPLHTHTHTPEVVKVEALPDALQLSIHRARVLVSNVLQNEALLDELLVAEAVGPLGLPLADHLRLHPLVQQLAGLEGVGVLRAHACVCCVRVCVLRE